MLEKLRTLSERYQFLETEIVKPEIIARSEYYTQCLKEMGENRELVLLFRHYEEILKQIESTHALLKDPEMKELAEEELATLKQEKEKVITEIQDILLSENTHYSKNIIIEIRAGTGGDEASLFALDLFRIYTKYLDIKKWKYEVLSSSDSEVGGLKEVVFSIKGDKAYKYFQFEGGGHRVQRVPSTEAQGRIHTSSCTVAVLPEPEEIDFELKEADLECEAFRSSGPGGQNVNKTSSAIRIVHLPTGITVACQEESSQHKNKAKALRLLRARILADMKEKADKELRENRKNQVGSGDRSDRIRTYNYPQNRATDHRIKESYSLEEVLGGSLDKLIEDLLLAERTKKLTEFKMDL
jgi:peptide chain release factor 1